MKKFLAVVKLLGWFLYFSLALLLVTIGAGAAMGAITGNWVNGVIVMFGGGLLLVSGEIGKTMLTKIIVAKEDLQRAFRKAADSIEDQTKDAKK